MSKNNNKNIYIVMFESILLFLRSVKHIYKKIIE